MRKKIFWKNFAALFLLPAFVYFSGFVALTWPQIGLFSSHFYTDGGDGLQMVWNIWWVDKAVTELHTHPWHTTWLHAPHGTSLLAHTLHPLKGFLSIPVLWLFSLKQTYNIALISSFVLSGITAFWLARHIKLRYWAAVLAGFIFTFSNYHFMHAQGHMQLVAMEWIPLYVLCLLAWLDKPAYLRAAGMAVSLFLVILCDYYYFFFCILTTGVAVIWKCVRDRQLFMFSRKYIRTGALFALLALPTSGVLAGSLVYLSATDPLSGVHLAREFPLCPFSLLIPGGHWRFNSWTSWYWSRLPGNINESSVHLGFAVITLLIFAFVYRKKIQRPILGLFWTLFVFFSVLALGQRLNIFGHEITWLPMPYVILEFLIPPFRISGVPVRMVTVAILSAGLLAAAGFEYVWTATRKSHKPWLIFLLALMLFEFLPDFLPTTAGWYPPHVEILKKAPEGAVYDNDSYHTHALYYQTIHEKPMAFGYISREPLSTRKKNVHLRELFKSGKVDELYKTYGFRYFVVDENAAFSNKTEQAQQLYRGHGAALFDIGSK
ncbi:MAG: hypothetical protein ACOCVH_00010 [Verrucomicrobiota bacterium]